MKIYLYVILLLVGISTAQAQIERPKFSKTKVRLASKIIEVEVADEPEEWSHGLMFKKSMHEDEGMLFVFPNSEIRSFWMKNTFIPLTIGYFDSNRRLINTVDMKPVKSEMESNLPSYKSEAPAKYALEMNQGWFKKNQVKPGEVFHINK